jgi:hypothetical protein
MWETANDVCELGILWLEVISAPFSNRVTFVDNEIDYVVSYGGAA